MTKSKMNKSELRQQAEAKLNKREQIREPAPVTEASTLRLIHELQVHQIELEMQNEQMIQTYAEKEEEHRQYTDLYDFAPVGYFTLMRDGTILLCNLIGANLLGVGRDKLIKRRLGVFISVESSPAFGDFLERVFSSYGSKQTCEIRLLKDGGDPVWIHLETSCDAGRQECCVVMIDITERKKAEEALRVSEDKFKYFFDHSPVGKSITLPSGEIHVNLEFASLLGYSEEELQRKKWQDITCPDDIELTQREVDALVSGKKESARFTKRYLKKDGAILWADVSSAIRRDAAGKPMYLMTSAIDITEQKQTDDALIESESLYRKMIENSPLGMHFYKLDHNDQLIFLGANPAANKLLGVDHSQFVGKTIEEAFPSLIQTEVPARYRDAAAKGISWSIEQIAYEGKQITGAFEVKAFQTMPGKMVAVFANITERKKAEEALRASEVSLQGILHSTADGILAVSKENKVVFANEHFAEMWKIPQEIIASKEDAVLLQSILGQLVNPQDFLLKVQELYKSKESSFDTLYFKDGRVFERVSRPLIQDDDLRGRVWSFRDVTERKLAEEALSASEERYKSLVETQSDLIARSDLDGHLTFVNDAYCKTFGKTREELLGKIFTPTVSHEDRPIVTAMLKAIQVPPYQMQTETRHSTPSGVRWLSWDNVAVMDEFGEVRELQGIGRDITERKQAERFIQDIISKNPMSIQVLDKEGFTLETNPAYKLLFGSIPPSDYSIFNDLQLVQIGAGAIFDQLRKGKMVRFPDVYFNPHDSISALPDVPVWVRTLGFPLLDSDARPERFILMHENITERKQTEKLQNSLYKIAQAADRSLSLNSLFPDIHAIIQEVMPADNFYIALYDEKKDLISYPYGVGEETLEELPRKPGKGLTEYVLRTAKSLLCNESLEKQLQKRGEIELVGMPSPIWLGVPLITAGKAIGVMAVQDYKNPLSYGDREKNILEFVSSQVAQAIDRKRSEEEIHQLNASLEKRVEERTAELREAQEKIVRQEKLAVLGQLAGGIGHELRNPLGVINNAIYYLKLIQPDTNDKVKSYHSLIEQEVHTAEKIVVDLLDFAKGATTDSEWVSIPDLVNRVLARVAVPDSVHIAVDFANDLPTIRTDPLHLEQVMNNLITNACQAIIVNEGDSTKNKRSSGEVHIAAKKIQGMVKIEVTDTGEGILPENMKRVFEPLFTTKLKGIGLGLAVSRKLIQANGGQIEFTSKPGKGSKFTVTLPIKKTE